MNIIYESFNRQFSSQSEEYFSMTSFYEITPSPGGGGGGGGGGVGR